ncbi:hypothetical protein [Fundidesulfovibrio terrae]|uniref:hypothetical protein n=1 Tax=Fundidesulfovibrio terrae TaxID=2922866 RepID=UPI003C2D4C96
MPMFDTAYLEKLEAYFASGDLEMDFEYADEEKRGRILDFLEKLMDVADQADQQATKLIFKDGLDQLLGANTQK